MSSTRSLSILGSTGSIGRNTLDVVSRRPEISVFALSAHTNVELLAKQCAQFRPRFAVVTKPSFHDRFKALLKEIDSDTVLLDTINPLEEIASHESVDTVMAAIVGATGLSSSLAAAIAGKRLLLANKESLIMSGQLFTSAARDHGAEIIPIDSEHNAIFQCLAETRDVDSGRTDTRFLKKIILTASGGPFLRATQGELATVTPDQACAHPKWSMGRKISVDSATLMNKGLELIEACFLFDLPSTAVEVLVHPQSIVHSMVYYQDGSVLAQMANPDMRVPIAYGLAFPKRMDSGAEALDLTRQEPLQFQHPDLQRFPCLALGRAAMEVGGTGPALLNAANEVAVEAFLQEKVQFLDIPRIIDGVLSKIPCEAASSLAIIREADKLARIVAKELI